MADSHPRKRRSVLRGHERQSDTMTSSANHFRTEPTHKSGFAVNHPNLDPGAIVFENVSNLITRPW